MNGRAWKVLVRGTGFRVSVGDEICQMGFYATVFSSGADEAAGIERALEIVGVRLKQRPNVIEHGDVAVDEAAVVDTVEVPPVQPGIAWYQE